VAKDVKASWPLKPPSPSCQMYKHLNREERYQIHSLLKAKQIISERPSHIEDRKQVGHWEGVTVIVAAHIQDTVTLVESKSGFALLVKVPNKSADLVGRAIEAKLKPLNSRVKTLTVDNGKEFADHQAIDQALGIQTYFADPYSSL
jgi:IS30 family transposase